MLIHEASRTALATAYLRAAHQVLDAKPLIFEDPVALRLLGKHAEKRIKETAGSYRAPGAKALRSHVVLRTRYTEDRLAAAVQRGVRQYAILGAGFDTFILRQPQWAASLRIVEIDHPDTQEAKSSRCEQAGFSLPDNVVLAPLDFANESLPDALAVHGITPQEPAFFSWLGVAMYLEESAIEATLRTMGAYPEGSEVVLTFLEKPEPEHPSPAERTADAGEPLVSYLDREKLERMLKQAGFSKVGFLTREEAERLYFKQRPTDLPVPYRTGIAYAIV